MNTNTDLRFQRKRLLQKMGVSILSILLVISYCGVTTGCGSENDPVTPTEPKTYTIPDNLDLLFQSGFEPTTEVVESSSDYADITGADGTFSDHNNWVNDLDNNPDIGFFNIQFQGGDDSQRYARIVSDPENSSNHVLQFWLNEPNVNGTKGRIQANLYGNAGMKEIHQSVRLYLASDFNVVRKYPNVIDWLTIAEFWNNITWDQNVPYGFRITLTLSKPVSTESDLYFKIEAQDCELHNDGSQTYTTLWSKTNTEASVPIGKWFTLEYYYKEGGNSDGKFILKVKPDDEDEKDIFNLTRITHNSYDPAPDGVTEFNPMKLYTSANLINWVNSQGMTLQLFWDDFKLWTSKAVE